MESITLKGTDRQVSRLCIGGCPAGEYGWGNVSHEEIKNALRQAAEIGVTFFDTADVYGLGRSEETLGEVLHDVRHRVSIATKFGVRYVDGHSVYDNSPAYIEQALNASLKRLKSDYIDLYQIHYLDEHTPVEAMMETLMARKRKGDIRAIGLSNVTPEQAERFLPFRDEIATFQNHFSLAHRDAEKEMRAIADKLSLTAMTWGSLGQGILTGKYGADVHFESNDRRSRAVYDNFYGEKLQKNLRIVDVMRPMAEAHGVPVASIAVRWILDELPNSIVLTGVKSAKQAEDNALATTFTLTGDELAALNEASRQKR